MGLYMAFFRIATDLILTSVLGATESKESHGNIATRKNST
jgi:hypothetical protein